jgi:PTS system ascorbate-specific IIB component
MVNIVTVCGNGLGSSLMLKMAIEEICEENHLKVNVESSDFHAAQGKKSDLIVTVNELAKQFDGTNVVVVRSYINKKKIAEDVVETIKKKIAEKDNA